MVSNIVKRFLHTRMRVNDLEKTVQFYREVLGLEEVDRKESNRGSKLVFLKIPGSQHLLEITYYPQSGPVQVQPDLVHLAFEVDSMDDFSAHLKELGMGFSSEPEKSKSSGSVYAFIDAPEGYEIELIQVAES